MTQYASYPHGHPCWVDLSTRELDPAKAFYQGLFGWTAETQDTGGGPPYLQFLQEGRAVAGLGKLTAAMLESEVPPVWNSYFAVEDASAAERAAQEAGGRVLMPTIEVTEAGRMNVLADPEGAAFCTWQAGLHHGAQLSNIPNTWCWNELATRNLDRAASFYGRVFGWEFSPLPDTATHVVGVMNQGQSVCHLLQMDEKWGQMPSAWVPYFAVESAEEACEQAKALGGGVGVPPTDIPQGRFAVLHDDQGAHFYVIALTSPLPE